MTEFLTDDNVDEAKGMDAILIRGNCAASAKNLKIFAEDYGIKYVFTRSVGYNHIDLKAAKEKLPGYLITHHMRLLN